MLITLLFNCGIDDKGQYLAKGKTFDVSKELAEELVGKGRAIIPEPLKVETTRSASPENAALRLTKPPPRKYTK